MNADKVVALIERTYRTELSADSWLQGVSASAAAVFDSQRTLAFHYEASENWITPSAPAIHGFAPEFAFDFFDHRDAPPEAAQAMARVFLSVRFGSLRDALQGAGFAGLQSVLDRYGVDDMLGINGLDLSGRGCMLVVAVPKRRLSSRTVNLWHRLSAHISAGNRLRKALAELTEVPADPTAHAEAVLSTNGRVEHATGPAESRRARDALREALVRIDAARSERDNPERSVELWRGLVAGRWSLVEHFERDGRRYYLAHKNDPELGQDRRLTLRERQVLAYAQHGNSNKLTAYALGLSTTTVSSLLGRARRKLGGSSE